MDYFFHPICGSCIRGNTRIMNSELPGRRILAAAGRDGRKGMVANW